MYGWHEKMSECGRVIFPLQCVTENAQDKFLLPAPIRNREHIIHITRSISCQPSTRHRNTAPDEPNYVEKYNRKVFVCARCLTGCLVDWLIEKAWAKVSTQPTRNSNICTEMIFVLETKHKKNGNKNKIRKKYELENSFE